MSTPTKPSPAKLIASVISSKDNLISHACEELSKIYGKIDFISDLFPFNHTNYYHQEMGFPLWRRFISFCNLIPKNSIPDIKLKTNELERGLSNSQGRRRVNIDPGYISLENLILATGKNYTHRIYLDEGIYADLTLMFKEGGFRALKWTYPDYKSRKIIEIFNGIRERYRLQLKTDRGI
jgi:hypothetical protein